MERLDRLETQKRFVRRTLHSVPFFAKAVFRRVETYTDLRRAPPRDTAAMAQRPVILTGFHFTKTTLAALSERYEIAGHMDRPDPAHIPPGAADTCRRWSRPAASARPMR